MPVALVGRAESIRFSQAVVLAPRSSCITGQTSRLISSVIESLGYVVGANSVCSEESRRLCGHTESLASASTLATPVPRPRICLSDRAEAQGELSVPVFEQPTDVRWRVQNGSR